MTMRRRCSGRSSKETVTRFDSHPYYHMMEIRRVTRPKLRFRFFVLKFRVSSLNIKQTHIDSRDQGPTNEFDATFQSFIHSAK